MLNKNRVEVYKHLDKVAEFLGCRHEDLVIFHSSPLTRDYQGDPRFADRLLKSEQLYSVEESHYRRHGSFNHFNVGIHLYENRKIGTRYCVLAFPSEQGPMVQYTFVVKSTVFKLQRAIKRLQNEYERSHCVLPILDKAFIDQILDNTIRFLENSDKLKAYGAKLKRGIILSGLPGNGKTMLCKYISAIATIKGFECTNISAPHIEKSFADGSLPQLLNQEGLLFIDDVDISYFDRREGRPKASVACSLLSAMDGLEGNANVVRIFTTNEDMSTIDPAFLRPGRIDKFFCFTKPSPELRKRFIQTWHKDIVKYIDSTNEIDAIVENTDDLSFAEMDLVRTSLVEEFIQDGKWDIDKALETLKCRLENRASNPPQKKIGFGSAKKQTNRDKLARKATEAIPDEAGGFPMLSPSWPDTSDDDDWDDGEL